MYQAVGDTQLHDPSVKTILVADEDPIIAFLILHIFTRRDRRVVVAADARELEERLEEAEYDAILVDVRLLEDAGEWVKALVRLRPHLASRLVLMSSREPGPALPVRATLRKPLELDELVTVVDSAIAAG